jgi:hypothetical protein
MKEIGFVIWGLRAGFKNDWLVSNVDSSVLGSLTDEMRAYCFGTITEFFSIEKVNGFTVLTIYNPNTTDHVGRRAYIAISLVVSERYGLSGNVVECLQEMMSTYLSKQGKAMINKVSSSDFLPILAKISTSVKSKLIHDNSKRIGILKSQDSVSFNLHFQDLSISEFKKVYFLTDSINALERKEGVEFIQAFRKSSVFSLEGYSTLSHEITINNKKVEGSNHLIYSGDVVRVTHMNQQVTKKIVASGRDINMSTTILFPKREEPVTPQKEPKSPLNKILLVSSITLVIGFGIVFGYLKFFSSEPPPPPPPPATEITAAYNFKKLNIKNLPEDWGQDTITIHVKGEEDRRIKFIGSDHRLDFELFKAKDKKLVLTHDGKKEVLIIEYKLPDDHTVKADEIFLGTISERYDIPVDKLKEINNLDNDKIKPGDILKLKVDEPAPQEQSDDEDEPNDDPDTGQNEQRILSDESGNSSGSNGSDTRSANDDGRGSPSSQTAPEPRNTSNNGENSPQNNEEDVEQTQLLNRRNELNNLLASIDDEECLKMEVGEVFKIKGQIKTGSLDDLNKLEKKIRKCLE